MNSRRSTQDTARNPHNSKMATHSQFHQSRFNQLTASHESAEGSPAVSQRQDDTVKKSTQMTADNSTGASMPQNERALNSLVRVGNPNWQAL